MGMRYADVILVFVCLIALEFMFFQLGRTAGRDDCIRAQLTDPTGYIYP